MLALEDIANTLLSRIESKLMVDDLDNWNQCVSGIGKNDYVPLQYKSGFLNYQEKYFKDVYEDYRDISMVLYRGGRPVGIWPICIFIKEGKLQFGTAGTTLMGPLLPALSKAEGQRAVIENCLQALFTVLDENGGGAIICNETILDKGASQWIRKLMEHGGKEEYIRWQLFVDLSLPQEEVQSRIRRTNRYSVAKGYDTYDIEIYDENTRNLDDVFDEFHAMHREVAGRETRSMDTWIAQEKIVRDSSSAIGRSFLIFIRDKGTNALAGAALFDSTPQTGLYCVAAYDRLRFSKPVGHIVQAVAMEQMKSMGIRWYEIGERAYPGDNDAYDKLVDIGHYKEGFATHFFPRVFVSLDSKTFSENILK